MDRIVTGRLEMRQWVDSDIAAFCKLNADSEVMRYFPSVYSREESEFMVQRIQSQFDQRGFGLWVVEIGGAFAGFTGLNETAFDSPIGPHIEIGWRFATWAWGNGYATEAANAALRVGFDEYGLGEIYSFTTQTNTRSEAVMKRIGMRRRADLEFDHPNTPGWWGQRHIVYQLTVEEWRKLPGAMSQTW